jgi:hypothetical protein
VSPRPKTQKPPNLNSPTSILFVIQRKTAEFPQNIFIHLVTLFPVRLRVHPFSEPHSKNPAKNSNPIPSKKPKFLQSLMVPIIKGLRADSY